MKDLSLLGRDLKDVIIVDNSQNSYMLNPENALASRSWYEDLEDRELFKFLPILQKLASVNDVRPYLAKIAIECCTISG